MKNITHLFLTILFFCCFQNICVAQQTGLTTFHRYNWQFVNPAAIDRLQMFGQKRSIITGGVRQQWVGLEGAPTLYTLSFEHMPYDGRQFNHPIKWGFNTFTDRTDKISTTGISLNFSYFLDFGRMYKKRRLFFGVNPSAIQYRVNGAEIKFKNASEPLAIDVNQTLFDFSFGVFYQQTSNGINGDLSGFYGGLSVPQSFALNLQDQKDNGIFSKDRVRHVYLLGGAFLPILDNRVIFEPSTWIRYVPGYEYETAFSTLPVSMDFSIRAHFSLNGNNLLWVGGGYGSSGNLKSEIGISLDTGEMSRGASAQFLSEGTLRFGFGWELPLSNQTVNLGQTLDVTVSYAWD